MINDCEQGSMFIHQKALGGFSKTLGVGSGGINRFHSLPISNMFLSSGTEMTLDLLKMYSDVGRRSGLTFPDCASCSTSSTSASSQSGAGRQPSSSIFLGVPRGSRSNDDELVISLLKTLTGGSGAVSYTHLTLPTKRIV